MPRNRRFATLFAPLVLSLSACVVHDGRVVPVTPQRPTISSDTSTVPETAVELEAGIALDPGDALDTPVSVKYGLGERTEAFVGFSPLRTVERPGNDGEGIGDLLVGVRHRVQDARGDVPSYAVQVAAKVATADEDEGLGSGENDVFAAGIVSGRYEDVGWTAFYQLGALGDRGGDLDAEHTIALAATRPLTAELNGFGEIASVLAPEQDRHGGFVTLGVAAPRGPGLVLDAALVLGFDDAPDLAFLVGFTTHLGRVRR